jgi:Fe-S-cluster containining protein
MGRHQVKFSCHSCGYCCTEVVCLPTPYDVVRIVRDTQIDPRKFLEFLQPDEIDEVEADDPTWLNVGDTRYVMALRRGKKGCHFLRKKKLTCRIYESRPLLCRLYPFKYEEDKEGVYKGFSLHGDIACPRHRDGTVPTEPLKRLLDEDEKHQRDYNNLVAVFNKKDDAYKKPEDFISMFVEVTAEKTTDKKKKTKK